ALAKGLTPREAMQMIERFGLKRDGEPADSENEPAAIPVWVERLQDLRGWSAAAVQRLGLGFRAERGGGHVDVPVPDVHGTRPGRLLSRPNRQTRGEQPKLRAEKGTTRELFPGPETVTGSPLWIVEGEPDVVAAFTLNRPAVGVPGAQGWKPEWAGR